MCLKNLIKIVIIHEDNLEDNICCRLESNMCKDDLYGSNQAVFINIQHKNSNNSKYSDPSKIPSVSVTALFVYCSNKRTDTFFPVCVCMFNATYAV